ncbi:MAG: NAD(P)(+) transhydrogenase (Re/Si-specific) subunit beta [Clostridiales bacterium]|nr:NAD(P)(+) transhydrogenase (Re/Si-specific) subunit beta [Clostridiales bacterium]MDD7431891.1 NAD(P)(+) transhydrogenase (Re/Si-specific) subunit beta [Clostridiales bacterium]MDY3061613.1 NAD(P)(+) transhydrogenase (Re/Si-specific) subunit beta [Eubacteriales bacterium]
MLNLFLTGLPVLALAVDRKAIYYAASVLLIALVMLCISRMSKVETAVSGNRIGALSMFAAILLTLWYYHIFTVAELWIAMLIGAALGLWISAKVQMIQMPQMVGLLNGFGGLASMIAGILTLLSAHREFMGAANVSNFRLDAFSQITAGLAVVVGGLTWAGSAVAAAKLAGKLQQRPVIYPLHQLWTGLFLLISLVVPFFFAMTNLFGVKERVLLILIAVVASNLFGYFFAIRVGGADMPITISLLNSFSGVAGSIAGMAMNDILLVAVGGIVGASGLLLTQIMCRSMNRHLFDILLGKSSKPLTRGESDKGGSKSSAESAAAAKEIDAALSPEVHAAQWLQEAQSVIIVPGYGMARSQAQPLVKQLADRLESEGKKVRFAIHPVAGRMPGHMNVLLAEVDVPYEKLFEMQAIDGDFKETDLAIVIGANDVINPAANTAEGTPIYGMPVLSVADARHILILNFDLKPGYAGVENPLYAEAQESHEHVEILLGDAKESLNKISKACAEMKTGKLSGEKDAVQVATADSPETPAKSGLERAADDIKAAATVIIVPGYGMARSQAQPLVKQLADRLESEGKKVRFAIHPVAGRMPGHMNVLLAEVDVPYEKLFEMQAIDGDFKDTDMAIVIGANDVINPAANTAEGTPIYGMPVLSVADARHILILNFDLKPGYAGVENPLYAEAAAGEDHVIVALGDAKDSLNKLLALL